MSNCNRSTPKWSFFDIWTKLHSKVIDSHFNLRTCFIWKLFWVGICLCMCMLKPIFISNFDHILSFWFLFHRFCFHSKPLIYFNFRVAAHLGVTLSSSTSIASDHLLCSGVLLLLQPSSRSGFRMPGPLPQWCTGKQAAHYLSRRFAVTGLAGISLLHCFVRCLTSLF